MWILFAAASALFAGLSAIFGKYGVQGADSDIATAVRTIIVLVSAWLLVFITGAQSGIGTISCRTWLFLVLSGLATGASWLCYFKALQKGDVNKVVPVDKCSIVLTIVLAALCFNEPFTLITAAAVFLTGTGTLLMIEKNQATKSAPQNKSWLLYAAGSAIFASLTAILGKIGIENINSNLGTAIRTAVVLVMAWGMVAVTGKLKLLGQIKAKEMVFICLSGLATGASWLCYYHALQNGLVSVVVAVDKLSVLVTIAFAWLVFGERLTLRSMAGLVCIVVGTLLLVLPPA